MSEKRCKKRNEKGKGGEGAASLERFQGMRHTNGGIFHTSCHPWSTNEGRSLEPFQCTDRGDLGVQPCMKFI